MWGPLPGIRANDFRADQPDLDLGARREPVVIPTLVSPQSPWQELLHGPIASPLPPPLRPLGVVYGVSTVGDGGRIVDRQAISWLLTIHETTP
ncbi:hypothetical protein ACQP1O_17735 [Nocardia sp. CA-151230]|uniref:hypothetical protein n=1 Tax=Nocardia sp. CA-151230 TaxID=3239982 RepID=UPI003D8F0F2D